MILLQSIKLFFVLIPVIINGIWDAFDMFIWNWLQKEKNKPLDPLNQWAHDLVFDSKDEFVEFFPEEFASYDRYDKAYPDRFDAKYDENLNRIN